MDPYFWSNALIAILGSATTVAIALITYLLNRRRMEKQVIRTLTLELHTRRALLIPDGIKAVKKAKSTDDFIRVSSSVLSMRDDIKRARNTLRPFDGFQTPLSAMIRSCNNFLEESSRNDNLYRFQLNILKNDLSHYLKEICQERNVEFLEPGAGAL